MKHFLALVELIEPHLKELKYRSVMWWSNISVREQRLISLCGLFICAFILYTVMLKPVFKGVGSIREEAELEASRLNWTIEKANSITLLRGDSSTPKVNARVLNQIVTSSATRYDVEIIRFQAEEETLQVWIEPLIFNNLLDWLGHLNVKYGVVAGYLDIKKMDREGMVDVNRLQLKNGD